MEAKFGSQLANSDSSKNIRCRCSMGAKTKQKWSKATLDSK